MTAAALEVIETGPLALVQDLGRPGYAALGVGASGAMDRAALALGNRLVGNPEGAAGLELLFGGLCARFTGPGWIALTGAWAPATIGGRPIEPHTATLVESGDELRIGAPSAGVRCLLAIRGGLEVAPVLGSRSRDTLAALGPAPLVPGDRLAIGAEPTDPVPAVDVVPIGPPTDARVDLAIRPGPRREWFTDAAWRALTAVDWTVSPRSDRTGIRLDGPALDRRVPGELASEGMLPGAIQVSPDGAPTILGPDHPVTGGYPVIAVVTDTSLDALAQLRPGQPVRFVLVAGEAMLGAEGR